MIRLSHENNDKKLAEPYWLRLFYLFNMNFANSENLIKLLTLMCNIVLACGVGFGMYQYERTKAFNKVKAAMDLSLFYKENILKYISIIRELYEDIGIINIINAIDKTNMNQFDYKELSINVGDESKMNKLRTYTFSEDFMKSILHVYEHSGSRFFSGIDISIDAKEKKKIAKVEKNKVLSSYLDILNDILNNLEYFSACFIKGVADSDSVYQMLHQSYLKTIEILYFEICSANCGLEVDKYYTNIILLYNLWKNKTYKICKNIQKNKNIEFDKLINSVKGIA